MLKYQRFPKYYDHGFRFQNMALIGHGASFLTKKVLLSLDLPCKKWNDDIAKKNTDKSNSRI